MTRIPEIILMIETSSENGRDLLKGIIRYCNLHGPWVFHLDPDRHSQTVDRKGKIPWYRTVEADGIIVRNLLKPEEAVKLGLPTIFDYGGTKITGMDWPIVVTDSVEIGKLGAVHLLERGFSHFAYCGYNDMLWSRERCEYFVETVSEAGFEVQVYQQSTPKKVRSQRKEKTILVDWLESLPKPIGLLACNDDRAMEVIETCKIASIRVPDEIAVLGVDNDLMVCNLCYPPISSINIDYEHAGYEAAELMDNFIAGEKMNSQNIMAPSSYVVTRQSTDIFAINDTNVAEALRFIQQHSFEPIQVHEVVGATALSRRYLHQKFRQTLGRSIHEEITRVRVEKICQLLIETNLNISQIAFKMGFMDDHHLARYFQKRI